MLRPEYAVALCLAAAAVAAVAAAAAAVPVQRWLNCSRTDDCEPGGPQRLLYCRAGDRRCLSDADCAWSSLANAAAVDCTRLPERLPRGHWPHWVSGCRSSDDCEAASPSGERLYCFMGDRRCITAGDCKWASSSDKTPRNCEPIPEGLRAGLAGPWQPCNLTSDCDSTHDATGLTGAHQQTVQTLCHVGFRVCTSLEDCLWATCGDAAACEAVVDHCYNGRWEWESGAETDVDCGGQCGPCALGRRCAADRDCQSGACRLQGSGDREGTSLCVPQ
eukprot:m51a1_g14353 hypothetical protein (276) ;mRNA; r:193732-194774